MIPVLLFLLFLPPTVAVAQGQDSYEALRSRWLTSLPQNTRKTMDSYVHLGVTRDVTRYSLAMEEVTTDQLQQLKASGIDMNAIDKYVSRRGYKELAVVFECIVIGTVKEIISDTSDNACFHTLLRIDVQEFLRKPKHLKPNTQLTVVLRSGKLRGGKTLTVSHEFMPEEGSKYILFLSNHGLRYAIAFSKRACSFQLRDDVFNASERSPRLVGNEAWIPDSKERVPLSDFLNSIKSVVEIITK